MHGATIRILNPYLQQTQYIYNTSVKFSKCRYIAVYQDTIHNKPSECPPLDIECVNASDCGLSRPLGALGRLQMVSQIYKMLSQMVYYFPTSTEYTSVFIFPPQNKNLKH